MTNPYLEPCPFPHEKRRGPFVEIDAEDFGFVRVSCSDCGCAGPYVTIRGDKPTKAETAEAVRKWNSRTAASLRAKGAGENE